MRRLAGRGPAFLAGLIYLCRIVSPVSGVVGDSYRRTVSPGKPLANDKLDEFRFSSKNVQHQVYPSMPSYDILNLPTNGLEVPHESLIDLLTKRQEYNYNSTDPSSNEFMKSLKLLRKLANKDESRQSVANQLHPVVDTATIGKRYNASLDEDINTINVLIGMLMLANRRLVEQRDKLLAGKTSSSDNKRRLDFLDVRKPQHLASYQRPVIDLSMKLAAPSKSLDLFNGTSFWPLASGHSALRQVSASKLDHVLVRPGYSPSIRLAHGASRVRGEQQSASSPSATGVMPSRDGNDPRMKFPHKPLVAHDLLHVNRDAYTSEIPDDHINSQRARYLFYEQLGRRGLVGPNLGHFSASQLQDNPMVPPYNGYPFAYPSLFSSPHHLKPQGFKGLESPTYSSQPYLHNSPESLHIKEMLESQKNAADERERRQREQALEVELRQVALRHEHDRMRQRIVATTTTDRPSQVTTDSSPEEPPVSQSPNEGQSDENNSIDQESLNELKQSLPGGFVSDDFTDLFPPGILSDAEIKEMRHQQQQQQQSQDSDKEDSSEEQAEQDEEQPEAGNNRNNNALDQQSRDEQATSLGEPADLGNQSSQQNSSARVTDTTPILGSSNNSTSPTSLTGRVSDNLSVAINRGATRFMPNLAAGNSRPTIRANKTRRSHHSQLNREQQVNSMVQLTSRHLPAPLSLTETLTLGHNQLAPRGRGESGSPTWASESTQPTVGSTLDQSFDDELM